MKFGIFVIDLHYNLSTSTAMTYNVFDIANHLLYITEHEFCGDVEMLTNLKLQKLLYYQQGYHLAMFGEPLFDERIEAWLYGPVVPVVYDRYKSFKANGIPSEDYSLKFATKEEEDLFNEVFDVYNAYSSSRLVAMTHSEMPWKSTPVGNGNEISRDKMTTFFKTLLEE